MPFKTAVYYNNFNLSTLDGVSVYDHDFIGMGNRVLNSAKLARSDRSVLTSAEYSDKTITIKVYICGSDKSTTELNYETLKGIIQIPEGTIRVEQATSQVEYIGTLNGITEQYFGPVLEVTLSFLCSNPIGSDRLVSTLLTQTNTASSIIYPVTVLGSFKSQPNIKITFTAVSGATTKTVKVLNSDSGQGISVLNTYTAGAILDIDVFNKTVTLNGALVDYNGVFPTFFPGLRQFQYIDDFTSRTVQIELTYNKQFA